MRKLTTLLMAITIIFTLSCPAFAATIEMAKQNNQTTTSNFPCNFNFAVSNMNRFNQGIYHG